MRNTTVYHSGGAGGLFLTQIDEDVLRLSVSSRIDDPALLRGRSSLIEGRQRAVHVVCVLLKKLRPLLDSELF